METFCMVVLGREYVTTYCWRPRVPTRLLSDTWGLFLWANKVSPALLHEHEALQSKLDAISGASERSDWPADSFDGVIILGRGIVGLHSFPSFLSSDNLPEL